MRFGWSLRRVGRTRSPGRADRSVENETPIRRNDPQCPTRALPTRAPPGSSMGVVGVPVAHWPSWWRPNTVDRAIHGLPSTVRARVEGSSVSTDSTAGPAPARTAAIQNGVWSAPARRRRRRRRPRRRRRRRGGDDGSAGGVLDGGGVAGALAGPGDPRGEHTARDGSISSTSSSS